MSRLDKINKARELVIKVDGFEFSGAYATLEQALIYEQEQTSRPEICRNHITGWSGVKESDVVDDGKKENIDFDPRIFAYAIGNRPDWWNPIAQEVVKKSVDRALALQDNKKK